VVDRGIGFAVIDAAAVDIFNASRLSDSLGEDFTSGGLAADEFLEGEEDDEVTDGEERPPVISSEVDAGVVVAAVVSELSEEVGAAGGLINEIDPFRRTTKCCPYS
jgi:hypothetical protein